MGRGFGVTSAVSHAVVRDLAGEAERLGYTSFWVNDMPHAEGLASLGAAAATTHRIDLGVGVVPLDQRSPAAIQQRVRELELPIDRLVLGVGSGSGHDALARVRSGVGELDRDLGARVVVGALGPRMSALAGEAADGVLFNWVTPAHVQLAGRAVLEAADLTRKPRPLLMAYVRCGVMPAAEPRLRDELARYAGIAHFEQHLERMGAGARDTCVLGADRPALQAGIARYEAVLDETIVRAVTPTDNLDDLLELVRACAPPAR